MSELQSLDMVALAVEIEPFPDSVLEEYWRAMPSPIDLDMEDNAAAADHLRRVLSALVRATWPSGTRQTPIRSVE